MNEKYTLTIECGCAQEAIDTVRAPTVVRELRRLRGKIEAFRNRDIGPKTEFDAEKMMDALLEALSWLECD